MHGSFNLFPSLHITLSSVYLLLFFCPIKMLVIGFKVHLQQGYYYLNINYVKKILFSSTVPNTGSGWIYIMGRGPITQPTIISQAEYTTMFPLLIHSRHLLMTVPQTHQAHAWSGMLVPLPRMVYCPLSIPLSIPGSPSLRDLPWLLSINRHPTPSLPP